MDEQMKQIVAALKPLFNELRTELRTELSGLRTELSAQIQDTRAEMRSRFEKVDSRFEKMDARFEKMDVHFDRMEKDNADWKKVARNIAMRVSKFETDIAACATKTEVTQQFSRLHDKIDGFLLVVEIARNERSVSDKSFTRHEDRLDGHEKRLARLEARRA